jgi:hypothetical protein
MVFSKVGPNQSIEWGQIRISKSRIASSALHWLSDALDAMKRRPQAVDRPISTNGKPVSDALSFLPACASDSLRS